VCLTRTYRAPRVHAWLRRQRCWSLVQAGRSHHAHPRPGRRLRPPATAHHVVDRLAKAAEDLLARNFNPAAPDVTRGRQHHLRPHAESWLSSMVGRLLVAESSGELGSAHLRATR
jgi:hypothetical protein